ncbi:MAG: DUF892 family protein [Thermoproteota archaeon]
MTRKNHPKARQLTINEKFVMYLNGALAIENAAIPRLQERVKNASLPEAKEQLRRHLGETREQQKRLQHLISSLGGTATREAARLPISEEPKRLAASMKKSITGAERQLVAVKEDAIIENAEIVMYDMLTQLAQIMGVGNAMPVLSQNLQEEREMADWLRANMPVMLTKLYPEIQPSIAPSEAQQAGATAEA